MKVACPKCATQVEIIQSPAIPIGGALKEIGPNMCELRKDGRLQECDMMARALVAEMKRR